MPEMPRETVNHILKVLDEVQHGSGCLAQELDSFVHHVDRDAGIASVAFDKARSRHGENPMQCQRCGYALAHLGLVNRNISRDQTHGGTIHLYPIEAYRLQRVSEGECERDLIAPLEERLDSLGLLE